MTIDEALKIVKKQYGLLESYVEASGKLIYVVAAQPQLKAIPGVNLPEHDIGLLASEVIELASGAVSIEALVRGKNPELFR
ncbi:MAG: hypothetical protein ACR2I2_13305 [Bryobacteraceae bacterium]